MVSSCRVLLVVPVGYVGGAENLFLNTAKLLPQFGVEPIYVCMRPGPLTAMARSAGMAAYEFEEHRYRNLFKIWKGRRWLADLARKTKADVIHATHSAHMYARSAGRQAGVPDIWHLHDFFNPNDRMEKWLQRIPTSHVIFATNVVKTGFPHLAKFPSTIIQPTCVDLAKMRATPVDPDFRKKLGLPEGAPIIATVTRLQAYKGHAPLIDAAEIVLKQRPDAVFAIAGGANNPEQKAYLAHIQSVVAGKGLTDRVKFIGFIDDNALVNLYRNATTLVHPALSEGFSVSVQEAMGMGVPAIVADADGPKELVQTWKAGVLVPKGDAAALATQILRVLNDPEWAKHLADTGQAAAEANPIQAMTERTANVYKQLVGRAD